MSPRQEARGNRTPPRPDLEQVRAKDGKLAAMQLQLTLNDQGASPSPFAAVGCMLIWCVSAASPDWGTPVLDTLKAAVAHAMAQHGCASSHPTQAQPSHALELRECAIAGRRLWVLAWPR